MNLNEIVAPVIGAINQRMAASVQVSTGSVTAADGSRAPAYAKPVDVMAQVQPLTTGDIRHMEGLNLQPKGRAIYVTGAVSGLERVNKKGGDLVTFCDGSVWLTTAVLEQWPAWCKFSATLQNGA